MSAAAPRRTPGYVPVLFLALAVATAQYARVKRELDDLRAGNGSKVEAMGARLEEYRSALQPGGPNSLAERCVRGKGTQVI